MNRLTIIIILIFLFEKGYSQSFEILSKAEYEVTIQPDSTDINSKSKLEKFSLYIGKNQSLFISNNRFKLDSIIYSTNSTKDLALLMSMSQSSSNKRIIKDNILNKIITYDEISQNLYKIVSDDKNFNWKIEKDTINKDGNILRKATTKFKGRNYIAWFNYEIPITDGPYKFNGLPGLIFELYDEKKYFLFSLTSFKNTNKYNIDFKYDNEFKIITNKEFLNIQNEYYDNPIPYMESEGAVFNEETKRIIRNRFKERKLKNNNPIELID
ncbi:MAG: GLPGLI family protein [Flavobacterium sp.]|nr:GLPGLI family protein [Flavobacterium sp.]